MNLHFFNLHHMLLIKSIFKIALDKICFGFKAYLIKFPFDHCFHYKIKTFLFNCYKSIMLARKIFDHNNSQGVDSSLPVCSVSCTVHLRLFTNIDILQVRPESTENKQICSTLSVQFRAYTISKGLAYIITLYTITSLIPTRGFLVNQEKRIYP